MEKMERHTKPETEVTIEEGLKRLAELSQLEARGKNVAAELEALVDKLTGLNAGEDIIKAAIKKGITDEYGSDEFGTNLDQARFTGSGAEMIPAYERKKTDGGTR